jgi:PAS domain S-box-containing protein
LKVKDLDFKFSLLDRLTSDVFNITIFALFIIIAGRIDYFRSFYFNGNSLFTFASAFILFLMGFYERKTYALGAFFGTTIYQLLNGLSPISSMAIGLGAGIEALIGFLMIKMFADNFKQKLEFLTRPTSILGIAIIAPLTKVFLLAISIYQFKNIHNESFGQIFVTNYLKDILSYLLLYPVITSKNLRFFNVFHIIFAFALTAIFQFESTDHFFYLLIFASLIPAIYYKDINAANVINLGLVIGSQFLIKYEHGPFFLSAILQTKVSYLLIFISFSLTILFIEGLIESIHFNKIRKKILILWAITAVAFIFSYNYEQDVEKENLSSESDFLRNTLEKKQNLYENNLRSLYGVLNTSTDINESDWKKYSTQLNIKNVYPEIDALGLILGESNLDFKNVLVYPEEKNILVYSLLKTENLDLLFSRFSLTETPVLSNNLSVTREYSNNSSSFLILPVIKDFKVIAWAYNLINHNELFSSISKDIKNYDFDVFDGTISNKNLLFKEVDKEKEYLLFSSVSFANHIYNIGWYKSTYFISSRLNITPLLCLILVIFNILIISYFLTILIQKIDAENLSDNLKKVVVDSEKRYKAIFSASSDGIVIFTNLKLIECNIKFYELFEIRTNLESLSFYDLFSTVQENFVESNMIVDQKIADTQKFDQASFEAICKRTSSVFNAEVKLNRLIFKNSEYFIASFIDITERKFTEKNLIKSKEFALEAAKAKSRFLSNMSHEIRTPLNGILGLVNIMLEQKNKLDKDQLDNLKVIEYSATHLVTIVNEILDYSKIENGSIVINPREVNLNDLTENIIALHSESAKKNSINLIVDFDPRIPKFILIDELRTGQILNNLLSNAIKFTPKGEITLKIKLLEKTDTHVSLYFAVKDSGIGIPEDKINYIFSEFTQADEDHSRKYGGTGLGLSITKKLIELQGGTIQVESIVNHGTTMSYVLKVAIANSNQNILSSKQNIPAVENAFIKKKVLLVEDNEVNILVAQKYLDKWGLEVIVAKDGLQAIDAAKNNAIDIILMDFHMPNMDGIEATKNIRVFNKEVPIIGLSADVTSDLRESFESFMMNDFVAKPFKSKELYSILSKYLNA